MAEAQGCNHDTLYRALDYPLPYFFSLCLPLCRTLGGPKGGYLLISSSTMSLSPLPLRPARPQTPEEPQGRGLPLYPYGFSLVVLAWVDARGWRRVPLAFLPYFADGEESKLDLALSLLE